MENKILILGALGFLGNNLYNYFKKEGEIVYGTCFKEINSKNNTR